MTLSAIENDTHKYSVLYSCASHASFCFVFPCVTLFYFLFIFFLFPSDTFLLIYLCSYAFLHFIPSHVLVLFFYKLVSASFRILILTSFNFILSCCSIYVCLCPSFYFSLIFYIYLFSIFSFPSAGISVILCETECESP